jgi:hypothetical protein
MKDWLPRVPTWMGWNGEDLGRLKGVTVILIAFSFQ